MVRGLVVLGVMLLSGCVSTYEYYGSGRYDSRRVDYVEAPRYSDGSYYQPPRAGYGDYYYGISVHSHPAWYDYPYYYSVFWPLQRSFVDPYWYPGYYYGVTYFPRNYFSIGISYGRPFGYLSYSPYRLSWVDSYYDWYPWYLRSSYYRHYTPRYGSARNEAERLARLSGARDYRSGQHDGLPLARYPSAYSRHGDPSARRDAVRGADYRSYGGGDGPQPAVSGFGTGVGHRGALDRDLRAPERGVRDAEGIPYPFRSDRPQRAADYRRGADDGPRGELQSRWSTAVPPERFSPRPETYRRGDTRFDGGSRELREYPAGPRERPVHAPREADYGMYSRVPAPRHAEAPATRFEPAPRLDMPQPRAAPEYREPPAYRAAPAPAFQREGRAESGGGRGARGEIDRLQEF